MGASPPKASDSMMAVLTPDFAARRAAADPAAPLPMTIRSKSNLDFLIIVLSFRGLPAPVLNDMGVVCVNVCEVGVEAVELACGDAVDVGGGDNAAAVDPLFDVVAGEAGDFFGLAEGDVDGERFAHEAGVKGFAGERFLAGVGAFDDYGVGRFAAVDHIATTPLNTKMYAPRTRKPAKRRKRKKNLFDSRQRWMRLMLLPRRRERFVMMRGEATRRV